MVRFLPINFFINSTVMDNLFAMKLPQNKLCIVIHSCFRFSLLHAYSHNSDFLKKVTK